jgi:hypothetical protein
LGLEDSSNKVVWINSTEVGVIPHPYEAYKSLYDIAPPGEEMPIVNNKTVFKTFRFPACCFVSKDPRLNVKDVRCILIRHKPNVLYTRKLAIDDLQIVNYKKGLGILEDLPIEDRIKNGD